MAQLGQDEIITYTAKNLRSGLTDLIAYILKPNGSRLGPFAVSEFADVNFKGFYFLTFATSKITDALGTYTGVIVSPTEVHRAPFKIVYEEISIDELGDITDSISDSIALLHKADVEVEIDELDEITVYIDEGA